jgi:hypothetical protein
MRHGRPFPPLAALGLLLLAAVAPTARAGGGDRVALDSTRLSVLRGDGTRLGPEQLPGSELELADRFTRYRLRVDAVERDPRDPSGETWLYALSVQDPESGGWGQLCNPDPEGRRLAVPIPGSFAEDGRYVPDATRLTLTCTSGAAGKCVRFGYKPWGAAPDGTPLTDLYRACVRMVRADYCGDGRSYTRDGTMIEVEDAFGILGDGGLPSPTRRFEAAWGPEGATCVDHVRVPARGTLEDVLRACPRLAGRLGQACTPARPDPAGALLTDRS